MAQFDESRIEWDPSPAPAAAKFDESTIEWDAPAKVDTSFGDQTSRGVENQRLAAPDYGDQVSRSTEFRTGQAEDEAALAKRRADYQQRVKVVNEDTQARMVGALARGWYSFTDLPDQFKMYEANDAVSKFEEKYTPEQLATNTEYQEWKKIAQDTKASLTASQQRVAEQFPTSDVTNLARSSGAFKTDSWLQKLKNLGSAVVKDPVGTISETTLESAPASLAMAAGAIMARFGFGTAGAATIGAGGASALQDFSSTYASNYLETGDHDTSYKDALVHSSIVGLLDAASIASAGRALDSAVGKSGILAKVKEAGKETAKQAGYGAGGEAGGSLAAGKVPEPYDVFAEAAGEVGGAAAGAPAAASKATYGKLFGQPSTTPAPTPEPAPAAPAQEAPAAQQPPPGVPPAAPAAPAVPELEQHATQAAAATETARAALESAVQNPTPAPVQGEPTASQIAIDPADPMASIAAIAAAPITQISTAQPVPAGVSEEEHQQAAGDIAAMALHAAQLERQAKVTPPAERAAVVAQAAQIRNEARARIETHSQQYGDEAAAHLRTTAGQTYHKLKGSYQAPVQKTEPFTEREQSKGPEHAETVRSDAGQVREGGPGGQPGVQPGAVEGGGNLQQPPQEEPSGRKAEGRGGVGNEGLDRNVIELGHGIQLRRVQSLYAPYEMFKLDDANGVSISSGKDPIQVMRGALKLLGDKSPTISAAIQRKLDEIERAPQNGTTVPKLSTTIDEAAHEAAASPTNELTPPTGPQAEAGNYKMGHVEFSNGLGASIETPSTAFREDKQHVPPRWRRQMKGVHYGYWKETEGADGIRARTRLAKLPPSQQKKKGRREGVDVMIKEGTPNDYNGPAFVIDQVNPQTGAFDEHKTMVGFASEQEARAAYQAQYEKGWKGLGAISQTTMQGLKTWMRFGDTSKPYAERVIAKGKAVKQHYNSNLSMLPTSDIKLGPLLADPSKIGMGQTLLKVPRVTLDGIPVKKIGGRKLVPAERQRMASIIRDAMALGVPAHRFQGVEGYFVFSALANQVGVNVTNRLPDGKVSHAIGIREDYLHSDDPEIRKAVIFTMLHETGAGHELDQDPYDNSRTLTSTSPMFGIRIVGGDLMTTGKIMEQALAAYEKPGSVTSQLLDYPFNTAFWQKTSEVRGTDYTERMMKSEVFAQLGAMWYTSPEALREEIPAAYELFKGIHDERAVTASSAAEGLRYDRTVVRDALRSRGAAEPASPTAGARQESRAREGGPGVGAAGAGVEGTGGAPVQRLQEQRRVPEREERTAPQRVLKKAPSARATDHALDYRANDKKPLGERASLNQVGNHLDKLVHDEYGGPLDITDPRAMARATAHAIAEVEYQVKQARTGLDWYEEDIKEAHDLTSKYIPELVNGSQAGSPLGRVGPATHRQMFSIVAGLHSPHQQAAKNWENAGIAYKQFVETGKLPEINPETNERWGPYVNPIGFAHLNSMVEDMGVEATVAWLLDTHPVGELNAMKLKYGAYKNAPVSGKRTDVKLGAYIFGEKVGPFTLGLNGINTEIAVDVWAARTLHRYMGNLMKDGEMTEGPHNEEDRAAFKQIAIDVAGATGYNPNQIQAVLWFFEQQLYTQLGLKTASPKFSDGARDLLERVGINDTGTEAGTGAERGGAAQATAEPGQAAAVVNIGLNTEDGLGIFPAEAINAIRAQGPRVVAREIRQSATEETLIATLDTPLTPEQAHAVAVELRQQAIAQKVGDKGALYGPEKHLWNGGEFDPSQFMEPETQTLQNQEMRGDGRGFTEFFTEASKGNRAPDKSVPYKPVLDISPVKEFTDEYVKHRGNFDDHIATSIPGFREVQQAVGDAIVKTYGQGATLLDIGASEGAFDKAITAVSDGKIFTLALDPNVQMAKFFEEHSQVPGADYDVAALGTKEQEGKLAWTEDDGTKIPYFKPIEKYDVVHEAMVFQFISNTREAQFARVKELMKPRGIALFEEKVIDDTAQWKANEAKKDAYKAQYYTAAQMAAKKKEVLAKGAEAVKEEESKAEQKVVGMNDLMVSTQGLEQALTNNWRHVAQYWDSGNFKGYVASDDRQALDKFLGSLIPLDSEYATTATPRYVTEGSVPEQSMQEMVVPTTPSFRKWFGDSQVVDENGQPQVVYHGSFSNIRRFSPSALSEESYAGPGYYFTSSAEDASHNYADVEGPDPDIKRELKREALGYRFEGEHGRPPMTGELEAMARAELGFENEGVVYPVYLKIENPYILRRKQEKFRRPGEGAFQDVDSSDNYNDVGTPMDFDTSAEFQEAVRAAGYDGIIDHGPARFNMFGVDDGTKHYVAFNPTQVKSATGNIGTYNPRSQDIAALIVNPPGPTGNNASWSGPVDSKIDDVVRKLQDRHIDTKRVVSAIREVRGQLRDELDVYLQEELFHGRAAKETMDFVERELNPLLTDMAARGVTIPQLEAYLHARHAEERNIQIARVNPKLPDGGSGMTTADARAYLLAHDTAAMRALAARVDAITAKTGNIMVNYGLESQATIDAWNNAYQHYVPLHRTDMDRAAGTGGGRGFSVKGKSKRATGSTLPVENILANIARAREAAVVRGEKNRVASALVGLAHQNPNPAFWSVDRPPKLKYIGPNGKVVETTDPMFKSRENVVVARMPDRNGNIVEHAVSFNEGNDRAMHMAKALNNLDGAQLGEFLGQVGKITRFLASINTQYNPVFGIVNLTRDMQQSLLNVSTTPIRHKKAKVLANILPALAGVYRDLRAERAGRPAPSAWAQVFEEFQREGAQTGYRDLFTTSDERAKAIERELKRAQGGKGQSMLAVGRWVAEWLSDYNAAMENAVRLSAYKVAREAGVSVQRSASLAKNLTVNFNRKGNASTQIGALYAFFNASAQGTARLTEVLRGPAGAKIIAGGITFGVLQAIALAASGLDDDEPPEWVKERNTIIPLGGKRYLTIPMPLGLHILPNIGRVATELALRGGKEAPKKIASLLGTAVAAFNPLGSATPLQTVTPTVLDPFAAIAENKDFTGKPIARENTSGLAPKPGHARARDTATAWSKLISRAINDASGGTEFVPGMFSPTPDQIDYLIGQVTGGVGRELGKTQQTISSAVSGEAMPTHKIPLAGRYYGNAAEQTSQSSKFYDNIKALNEHEAQIKGLTESNQRAEARAYKAEHPEARLVEYANSVEKIVSGLRKEKSKALEAGNDAKAERLDAKINETMLRFNERVKALR